MTTQGKGAKRGEQAQGLSALSPGVEEETAWSDGWDGRR